MSFIRDLKGHQSDRRSFIKHPSIYGTEEPTYTYFDDDGANPQRNIIAEGRLCIKGREIMGGKIDGCPFVYMPPNYWNSLTKDGKSIKAKGFFDRMIECKDKGGIPRDASFVVRVARMNVETSWCDRYGSYEPGYIPYKEYPKMTDEKFVAFLDRILGNSLADDNIHINLLGNAEKDGYIPTLEDYENARRRLLREGNKRVSTDNILDIIKNDLEAAGYTLSKDWRVVTEKNIVEWVLKTLD